MREIKYKKEEYNQNAISGGLIIGIVGVVCLMIGSGSHWFFQFILFGGFAAFCYFFGRKYVEFLKKGKDGIMAVISEEGFTSTIESEGIEPLNYKWSEIDRAVFRAEYLVKETRVIEIEFRTNVGSGKKDGVFCWYEGMDIEISELVSWLDHYGINIDNIIRPTQQIKQIKKVNMPFKVEEALFGESHIPIYKKVTTEKTSAIHVDFYHQQEIILSDGSRISLVQARMIEEDNIPALTGEIIDSNPNFKEDSRKRYEEAEEEAGRKIYTLKDIIQID